MEHNLFNTGTPETSHRHQPKTQASTPRLALSERLLSAPSNSGERGEGAERETRTGTETETRCQHCKFLLI